MFAQRQACLPFDQEEKYEYSLIAIVSFALYCISIENLRLALLSQLQVCRTKFNPFFLKVYSFRLYMNVMYIL